MTNEKNISKIDSDLFGGFWPGIQLYYPPVKYSPSNSTYEDLEAASARFISGVRVA
jgi:citrate lyase subunit beta/citryl-CoA lyase